MRECVCVCVCVQAKPEKKAGVAEGEGGEEDSDDEVVEKALPQALFGDGGDRPVGALSLFKRKKQDVDEE